MNIEIIQHNKTPSESVERLMEKLGKTNSKKLYYGKAVDKLTQYQFFKDNGIPHPEWSINHKDALKWQKDGHVVLCREKLKSALGNGVFVCTPGDELVDAKIYCKYQKKKREFRVNLFQHKVVNIREKKRKAGNKSIAYVWNPENGYTTTHPGSTVPNIKLLNELAEKASKVSDSDFIGVDVIYNEHYDKFYVLEVNSGPAIEGSSVEQFVEKIKEWYANN